VNYHRKIRKAREQLEMETGVRPSSAAISEELALGDLRLSPEKIEDIVKQVEHRPTSLDSRGGDGSTYETKDDLSKVGETAYSELDREADLVRGALREDLTQLMQRFLTADEARVLSLKFGLEDGEKRTMREVAEKAGVTYIKVKNTYNNALNRLRAPLVLGRLQNYLADLDE
jgi:DNA-directed RNA polymerase sigma subunit (sigma70/sigma32)